jgi:hypothetical protein
MAKVIDNRFGIEFGRAMCDRLGLPHNLIARDSVVASSADDNRVMVRAEVVAFMTREEFTELFDVAKSRSDG